jgi:hypothetical protein
MWLLILQRLYGGASLETAVLELLRTLPASFWPRPCKRVRDWLERGQQPSSNTGAYNQARQQLPLSVVQQSSDRIFDQLVTAANQTPSAQTARAFLLDGSSMHTAHSPALCDRYPPGSNQNGEGHWPLLRVVVAHDLRTGLAMRPEWGPMNGPNAVSEQALLEQAMVRLPSGSTLLGDANFGVFSFAYTATRLGYPVLLRLTMDRARRLAGGAVQDGIDRELVWRPSPRDRKSHPELLPDACVRGRLIVRQVQPDDGSDPFLLALFTTLPGSTRELLELYGQRWAIETDLRTLKRTLRLDQLYSFTPDMVAKEIEMGITAYNLVRALTVLASKQSGIQPRGYGFTKVLRIVQTFGPIMANAPNDQAAKRAFDQVMKLVQQSKLPRRTKKRPSYPRAVWKNRAKFPARRQ